ncbi:hypothetical protein C9I43_14205 [Shewanella morhuae]|uniref:ATPase domain-containing protein n=1 Tax=Shewanella morhuae TaxID=365591 RepID=A0ABX5HXC3_9GAMM|nr:ATP-binding protein [Shewanella morhuae]PTA51563.1 hypothetical protein C9I43_14205 [Shewanella morhuae]
MKKIFTQQLRIADEMKSESEKLNYLTAIIRSILQLAVTTSLEVFSVSGYSEDTTLPELIERFHTPSDGMPIHILDLLIPILRCYIDSKFLIGFFEKRKEYPMPLSKELQDWVQFRNSRQGHGVLDNKKTIEWSQKTSTIIKQCLLVFEKIIPEITTEKTLHLKSNKLNLYIKSPMVIDNCAIVILKISQKKSGWQMKAQLLSHSDSDEILIQLPEENIFTPSSDLIENYKIIELESENGEYHILEHNIPIRQTDTFEGREKELKIFKEWINDEDSRKCLIYGDGGYGKTTLLLEALNSLLENGFKINTPLPTVICYYTAKMTRWTSDGLTHYTSIEPVLDESVRELMKCLYSVLPKEWYTVSGSALIDKAVNELKKNGYTRDDILLVLDNTETLATTTQETIELARLLQVLGKKLGRIIITSRRQEAIEAKPILIEGLTIKDCVNLLQALAHKHKAEPIRQAGETKLRKISEKLSRKPILLEALVVYIGRQRNISIDQAMENLYKRSNEELLEFLYEDAWNRISQLQKEVFYILVSLTCPLDQYSISRACQLLEIQHSELQSSLAETHFASVTDYGTHYSLELVDLAKRFFHKKLKELNSEEKRSIEKYAIEVDSYAKERESIELAYRKDRVAEAFRSDFAKAAKVAVDKGDICRAIENFELAIEDDPLNSALHDRYSWLLAHKVKDLNKALEMSEKSVILNNKNCDAVVNLALIQYRLGELELGDKNISTSVSLGRPESFAFLQMAIARFTMSRKSINTDTAYKYLLDAEILLNNAQKKHKARSGYDAKNLQEILKFKNLVLKKLNDFRLTKV